LRAALRDGDAPSLTVATVTLNAMADGGVYDAIEGGFFRYSTTRDWSIPHFEKMLEGNAGLLANYLRAFQVTSEPRYAAVARDIMRYLDGVLSDAQGGFYGSQDADEQYYALALAQRQARPAPFVDRTLYVDWNAMMASSYLLAAAVLDDPRPQAFALQTLDRLWRLCRTGSGMIHYHDAHPVPNAARQTPLLSDQVHMAMALLDAGAATGDPRYLARAIELAEVSLTSMADADGGFRDAVARPDALGNLKLPLTPLPANAVAARLLVRLYWLTDREQYRVAAQRTLARFAKSYERLGYFGAPYALAVDEMLLPPVKVVIVGDGSDARLVALRAAALRLAEPWKIVQTIDPQRDAEAFAHSGFSLPSAPVAYPCLGATCLAPVSDSAALGTALRSRSGVPA
jgi:hypothetical protein